MSLSSEIKDNKIILLITPKEKYHKELLNTLKVMEKIADKTCYVCVNEPYNFVLDNLKKNKIDTKKFFFVDALTAKVQTPPSVDDCIFVSAPNALTEINLAFSKSFDEKKCDGLLFDTLSTLLVYENPHSIIQFIHNILTKLKVVGGKAVFVALKEDVNSELIKDLYMFVDKVVEVK